MKKGTKIGIGVGLLLLGATALSSCTQSFCSKIDSARIMYAFDPGFTKYKAGADTLEVTTSSGNKYTVTGYSAEVAHWDDSIKGFRFYDEEDPTKEGKKLTYFNTIISNSKKNGFSTVDSSYLPYYEKFDSLVIEAILKEATNKAGKDITRNLSTDEGMAMFNRDVAKYSYVKFLPTEGSSMWKNYTYFDTETRKVVEADICPSADFTRVYKAQMNSYANTYRTCLTTKEDKYGSYGYETDGVYINAKSWGYAWSKGFFEGLLVYPIGWLIDQIVVGFRSAGASAGAAALLGIIFVTLIVRSLMLLATFKQTTSNAKMTELQPEIQKIQNKYPNANTSQIEKQRMAEEMNRLYKKNKINPFTSLIVMIIQFPVFICVWGALSGSAYLTSGSLLGLNLSVGIKDVLFVASNWGPAGNYAAVTALILFLLMAGAQTVSMLLPQWIQKKKAKQAAKLGKNPAQKSQNTQMKIFTYVMLAMIIFMGFSLVSAMGIYWFVGAVFSIIQTVITQIVTSRKAKKK